MRISQVKPLSGVLVQGAAYSLAIGGKHVNAHVYARAYRHVHTNVHTHVCAQTNTPGDIPGDPHANMLYMSMKTSKHTSTPGRQVPAHCSVRISSYVHRRAYRHIRNVNAETNVCTHVYTYFHAPCVTCVYNVCYMLQV